MQRITHFFLPMFFSPSLLLILSVCLFGFSQNATAEASLSPPKISVRVRNSTQHNVQAKVKVRVPRRALKIPRTLYVEIERVSIATGQSHLISIAELKRRRAVYSQSLTPGRFTFRTRVFSSKSSSRWRVSREVYIPGASSSHSHPNESSTASKPKKELPDLNFLPGQQKCSDETFSLLLDRVNTVRAELPALSRNSQLEWAAEKHSLFMATKQELSHDGWSSSIIQSGFVGSTMGQNLARNIEHPHDLVDAWLLSSGHRNNLLSSKYRYVGFGCIIDAHGQIWWTQNFGG